MRYYKLAWQLTVWPAVCNAAQHMRTRRIHGGGVAEIVMETAKRNMMEQLRQKYLWKYGFSDMAKLGEERGQIGGGESGGSPEIICEEIFYQNGFNLVSTHGRFQWYPIFPAQNFLWLSNWPSKLKSHFFRYSFSRLTFQVRRGPCLRRACHQD